MHYVMLCFFSAITVIVIIVMCENRSHEADFVKEEGPVLSLTNEKYAHCSKVGCKMAQWNGEPYKIVAPR